MKNILATIGGILILAIIPHLLLLWTDVIDFIWVFVHLSVFFIIYIVESKLE